MPRGRHRGQRPLLGGHSAAARRPLGGRPARSGTCRPSASTTGGSGRRVQPV